MGKLKKGEFIIDYTFPLSFVQAFAIGLSSFKW